MENVATYSEARSEYTKQLATFIVPTLVGWFQQLWSRNASDKLRCLALFQTECEEIARWNIDRVQDEVRVLIERTGCDYMEELMTAVFIAHTKILTAVRMSTKQKKLSIHIPKLDQFIHRIFKEAARSYWKSPFLFMDNGNVVDRQKNILQIEAMATEAITTAVRSLLPVKQILRDYLEGDQEEIEEEEKPEVVAAEPEAEPGPPAPAPITETSTTEEKKEENKEEKPEPATPVSVEVQKVEESTPAVDVSANAEPPAVIKIDTEPAVRFSAYDDVYDEARGEPEMRHTPKDTDNDLDMDDLPSDGTLIVKEETATALSDLDAEDLEAPIRAVAAEKVIRDTIEDSEVEVLE
jgi:outer membrane biosynthesis protein TonB